MGAALLVSDRDALGVECVALVFQFFDARGRHQNVEVAAGGEGIDWAAATHPVEQAAALCRKAVFTEVQIV
ncbi:hypothetical protein D3C85_954730 [compost metagenome]